MPRVTFPDGSALYFPEGVDEGAMQRAAVAHWDQKDPEAQKLNISEMEPPPKAEMPSEAPGGPQTGSGVPSPVPPPQPEAQTAAQGPPSAPDATIGADPDQMGTRFGPAPRGVGDLFRGVRDVGREFLGGGLQIGEEVERIGRMQPPMPGQMVTGPSADEFVQHREAERQKQAGITDKYEYAREKLSEAMGTSGVMADDEMKRTNLLKWGVSKGGAFAAHLAPYMMLNPLMPGHALVRSQAAKITAGMAAKQIAEKEGIAALKKLTQSAMPTLIDAGAFGAVTGAAETAKTGDPVHGAVAGGATAGGVAALGLFGRALRDIKGVYRGKGLSQAVAEKKAISTKKVAEEMHPDRGVDTADRKQRTEFLARYNEAANKGDFKTMDALDKQWADYKAGGESRAEVARTKKASAEAEKTGLDLPSDTKTEYEKGRRVREGDKFPAPREFVNPEAGVKKPRVNVRRKRARREKPIDRRQESFVPEEFREADRRAVQERRQEQRREQEKIEGGDREAMRERDRRRGEELGKAEEERFFSEKDEALGVDREAEGKKARKLETEKPDVPEPTPEELSQMRLGSLKTARDGIIKRVSEGKQEEFDTPERLKSIHKEIRDLEDAGKADAVDVKTVEPVETAGDFRPRPINPNEGVDLHDPNFNIPEHERWGKEVDQWRNDIRALDPETAAKVLKDPDAIRTYEAQAGFMTSDSVEKIHHFLIAQGNLKKAASLRRQMAEGAFEGTIREDMTIRAQESEGDKAVRLEREQALAKETVKRMIAREKAAKTAAPVEKPTAKSEVLKVGDQQRVMDTEAIVERVGVDENGIRYEVFKGEDGRGFLRSVDADSGEVVSLTAYESTLKAINAYDEVPTIQSIEKPTEEKITVDLQPKPLFEPDAEAYEGPEGKPLAGGEEFAKKSVPQLYDRIGVLQRTMYDSATLAESEFIPPDTYIPRVGGLIAARKTEKYAGDAEYAKVIDKAIEEIVDTALRANEQAMLLQGSEGKGGPFPQAEKVEVEYGANVERMWREGAQAKYKELTERSLGNIGVREAFQNSLDAVLQSTIEQGKKSGTVTITLLGESAPWHTGYIIEDDGIGMSDVDIRDVFLKLHGSGKMESTVAAGRFGTGKAVALVPHTDAEWNLRTRDNYVDSKITRTGGRVQDSGDFLEGARLEVEAPAEIITSDAYKFIETTEVPDNINILVASGKEGTPRKLKNPFTRRKYVETSETVQVEDEQAGRTTTTTVTTRYYPRAPESVHGNSYDKLMVLRVVNPKTGVKLTQNVDKVWDSGFKGAIVVDVATDATPDMKTYPFDDARLRIEGTMSSTVRTLISKRAQEGLSASRATVTSNLKPIVKWSAWQDVIIKLQKNEGWLGLVREANAIHRETNEFGTQVMKGEHGEDIETDFEDMPISLQPRPFTPFNEQIAKVDVGYKGSIASMFVAKHLVAYETLARLMAGSIPVKMDVFYPLYSKVENGVRVNSEYAAASGALGFNPHSISKIALRSVYAYSKYMEALLDHEFTHYFVANHTEEFTSTLPRIQDATADLRPYIERIAKWMVSRDAVAEFEESLRTHHGQEPVTREVTKIITEEKIVDRILLPEEQELLYENGKRGIGGAEDDLYLPRAKGQPWQLGIFEQSPVAGGPDSGAGDKVSVDVGRGPEQPDRGGDGGVGEGGVEPRREYTVTDEIIEAGGKATRVGDELYVKFIPGSPPSAELKESMKANGLFWNRRQRMWQVEENMTVFEELEKAGVVVHEKAMPGGKPGKAYTLRDLVRDNGGIGPYKGGYLSEEMYGDKGREGVPINLRDPEGPTLDDMMAIAKDANMFSRDGEMDEFLVALQEVPVERIIEDELEAFGRDEGPADADIDKEMGEQDEWDLFKDGDTKIPDPPFSAERVEPKKTKNPLVKDPREEVDIDRGGERGSVGKAGKPKKIEKKTLTMDVVRSKEKEVEAFFKRTERIDSSKRRLKDIADETAAAVIERFVFLHHMPRTKEHAWGRERLRHTQEAPVVAYREAVSRVSEYLNGMEKLREAVDPAGLDLLRRKIFLEDMKVESIVAAEDAKAYLEQNPDASKEELDEILGRRTPLTPEQIVAELARIDPLVDATPSVKDAYELRTKLWREVSYDLADRGVISDAAAGNPHYARHFVLQFVDQQRASGSGKRLSEPVRDYAKHRKGTRSDWSTDLVEVEVKALSEIFRDNKIQDIGEEVAGHYDEGPTLKAQAKLNNYEKIVGGKDNVRRLEVLRGEKAALAEQRPLDAELRERIKRIGEEIWALDPTMPARTKIAIGISEVTKALGMDDGEAGDYFADSWDEFGEGDPIFSRLSDLLEHELPEVRAGTAKILKGINERRRLMIETLGKDYVTVESLAADKGLVPWQFNRGNIVFRARTITERDMAKLTEQMIREFGPEIESKMLIPESMLKSGLVMGGPKKQHWIPKEVAAQLNDLPVMHRDNLDVGLRRLILLWKGWILRINPIRYNMRNTIGDAEGTFAARGAGPFKKILPAVKLLLAKKGELYEAAREYGAIGSSMQYEFGTLRDTEEFKLFNQVKSAKTALEAFEWLGNWTRRLLQKPQEATQFREDILRMAVMMDAIERFEKGDFSHLAGQFMQGAKQIEAIYNDPNGGKYMAGAKISRESLIDYGAFTPWENEQLRQGWIPFYSWLKGNTLRWPRIFGNSFYEAKGKGFKGAARASGALGSKLTRTLLPYIAMILWNNRDDEARKREKAVIANQPWLSGMPHLTLDDGSVIYTTSAISDFLEWFDLEDSASFMHKYERGGISFGEMTRGIMMENAKEPINKVFKAINPFLKTGLRVSGLETFPDVFKPRWMYDSFSQKAFKSAFLDIMGPEVKRAVKVAKGKLTIQEALAYYFSGAAFRPMTPEKLAERLLMSFGWSALKAPSKKTGRGILEAKSGREDDWFRAKEGLKALGYTDAEIDMKMYEVWEEQKMEKLMKEWDAIDD